MSDTDGTANQPVLRGQPQALRRVAFLLVTMGAAILVVGLVLVVTAGDGGSVRMVGIALCGVGLLDLLSSSALIAVAGRRARRSGYDGRPVTYQPGDRPPGML